MSAAKAPAELNERIRAEIRAAGGAISFVRFMELALYAPGLGYYARAARVVGKEGDFYTSVSVGPVFGELLAFQFAEWLAAEPQFQISNFKFQITEVGAHDGRLARDILGWLRQWRPALAERIEYWIVEPSPTRREWQAETLAAFAGQVRWALAIPDSGVQPASDLGNGFDGSAEHCSAQKEAAWPTSRAMLGAPPGGQPSYHPDLPSPIFHLPPVHGVIFANELLDALPCHRLGWDAPAHAWFEWGVTERADGFHWSRLAEPPPAVAVPAPPDELLAVLPDGFTTETSPAAADWWRTAAQALAEGRLLTLDYGLEAAEFFLPQRADGTLRGYHRHRFADNVLNHPGEQDLTAQVNFTALRHAGETASLRTEAFARQGQWLTP